jgi:hypothetical protein
MKTSSPGKPVLSFAPQPLDLPEARVDIKRSRVAGPDSEDNLSIHVAVDLTNAGSMDWHRVDATFMIFDSSGRIIGSNRETFDQRIAAGRTCELTLGISRIDGVLVTAWRDKYQGRRLSEDLENVHLVVSAHAYTYEQQSLGELNVPDTADTTVSIPFGQIDGVVSAIGGMVWKAPPAEEDGMVFLHMNVVLQNLSTEYLPSVWLVADIRDKMGLSLGSAGSADELYPGELRMLSQVETINDDERTKGAIVALALRAYRLVATGMAISRGATHDPTAIRRGWGAGASSLVD